MLTDKRKAELAERAVSPLKDFGRHNEISELAMEAIFGLFTLLESEGYAVVPVEPTEAILKAMQQEWWTNKHNCAHVMKRAAAADIYKAMLSAADSEGEPSHD